MATAIRIISRTCRSTSIDRRDSVHWAAAYLSEEVAHEAQSAAGISEGGHVAGVSTAKCQPEDASVDMVRSTAIAEEACGIVGTWVRAFSGKSINPLDSAAATPSGEVADAAGSIVVDLLPVVASSDESISAADSIITDVGTASAIELIEIASSSEIIEESRPAGADFSDADAVELSVIAPGDVTSTTSWLIDGVESAVSASLPDKDVAKFSPTG
jgi:hypothetical protein